jgi:cellulose synthase/poly-beta-1,6-N-acetylglucosamine synthase-like glycosyltransferase
VLFWISGAVLFFTFGGYPLLMRWLGRKPRHPAPAPPTDWPTVTGVVVAFNEGRRIVARVENLLGADYPPEKLSVIVVSNGSTDDTVERVRALGDARITVLEQAGRAGKAAGLNDALAQCRSDLVVFSDARQRFEPATLRQLVRHFAEPAVGAVSGSLEIEPSEHGVASAVDTYWRMEKRLRADEARFDSCIGCTGAVYAIRRELFVPIPEDTVLDDVVIPMHVAEQKRRVLHDSEAIAYDPQTLDPEREKIRKQRTLAGNFQMLFRYPRWLVPWKHRLWWQLIAHKYLRLAAPPLLAIVFLASFLLCASPFYRLAFYAQVVFYALAILGIVTRLKSRLLSLPAGFVFLNATTVRALWHYLTRPNLHLWSAPSREKH